MSCWWVMYVIVMEGLPATRLACTVSHAITRPHDRRVAHLLQCLASGAERRRGTNQSLQQNSLVLVWHCGRWPMGWFRHRPWKVRLVRPWAESVSALGAWVSGRFFSLLLNAVWWITTNASEAGHRSLFRTTVQSKRPGLGKRLPFPLPTIVGRGSGSPFTSVVPIVMILTHGSPSNFFWTSLHTLPHPIPISTQSTILRPRLIRSKLVSVFPGHLFLDSLSPTNMVMPCLPYFSSHLRPLHLHAGLHFPHQHISSPALPSSLFAPWTPSAPAPRQPTTSSPPLCDLHLTSVSGHPVCP